MQVMYLKKNLNKPSMLIRFLDKVSSRQNSLLHLVLGTKIVL